MQIQIRITCFSMVSLPSTMTLVTSGGTEEECESVCSFPPTCRPNDVDVTSLDVLRMFQSTLQLPRDPNLWETIKLTQIRIYRVGVEQLSLYWGTNSSQFQIFTTSGLRSYDRLHKKTMFMRSILRLGLGCGEEFTPKSVTIYLHHTRGKTLQS